MSKHTLKKKISDLIAGTPEGDDITILYHNPVTGEVEVLYQSPAAKRLEAEENKEQSNPTEQ
jgi:hypothetical protein